MCAKKKKMKNETGRAIFVTFASLLVSVYVMGKVLSGWLVGCFGLNGPLRQYFSLYRAVLQREGERGKKG